jgi:hypothetical protein
VSIPRSYNFPTTPCACGCGGSVLIADTQPREEGDEGNVMELFLPSHRLLDRAFRIGGDAKAKAHRGEVLTEEEAVIIGLLDALLVHREVLTRIVVGVEIGGTDDELFDEGFDLAQDIIRAGFHTPDTEEDVPTSVRIDTSMVLRDLEEFEVEGDCEGDDDTVCDVPDCPVHGDKPVPTTYEA